MSSFSDRIILVEKVYEDIDVLRESIFPVVSFSEPFRQKLFEIYIQNIFFYMRFVTTEVLFNFLSKKIDGELSIYLIGEFHRLENLDDSVIPGEQEMGYQLTFHMCSNEKLSRIISGLSISLIVEIVDSLLNENLELKPESLEFLDQELTQFLETLKKSWDTLRVSQSPEEIKRNFIAQINQDSN